MSPLYNSLILSYNSLILPHLNYWVLIWGYKCERLTKLQKRIIRIISLGKYNSHTEPIFKSLKLLKLNDILKFENSKLPCYLSKLPLIRNTVIHGYDTRINHKVISSSTLAHWLACSPSNQEVKGFNPNTGLPSF